MPVSDVTVALFRVPEIVRMHQLAKEKQQESRTELSGMKHLACQGWDRSSLNAFCVLQLHKFTHLWGRINTHAWLLWEKDINVIKNYIFLCCG